MAEVLAVLGCLSAVAQLADAALKVAKCLHQFAADAGAAKAEVERFANQIMTFSDTMRLAQITMRRYCAEHPESPVVRYLSDCELLERIADEARWVRNGLSFVESQVLSIQSGSIWWTSIKWSLRKARVLKLSPEIESVKTSLHLVISIAQLDEALGKSRQGDLEPKLEKDIKGLRRAIKHLQKTMELLQLQLDPIRSSRTPRSSTSLSHASDPLIDLARSMRKRGAVPGTPSPSWTPEVDPRPPRPGKSEPQTNRSATVRGYSPPDPDAGPSSPSHSRANPSVAQPRSSTPLPPRVPMGRPAQPEANAASSPSSAPRPFSKTLLLNDDMASSRSGYVASSSGPLRYVTAFVMKNLDGNVISVRKAVELGLELRDLDPTDGVNLDFGTGPPSRSVGKVTLEWRKGNDVKPNPRSPPITVECEVCEDYQFGLILGRPFLVQEARQRQRRDSRAS